MTPPTESVRRTADASLFGSAGFLIALTLLIVNDFYLKAAHPGVVTGKLSDFAGLFVVGVVVAALWPARAGAGCWIVGALFVIWKSPAATPFIDVWNVHAPWTVARTIDGSDLIALVSLPVAIRYARSRPRSINWRPVRWASAALTLLAVMATSWTDTAEIGAAYDLAMPRREVAPVIDEGWRIRPTADSVVDSLDVDLPDSVRYDRYVTLRLANLGIDSTRLTLVSVSVANADASAESGKAAFESNLLPALRRHEALRLAPPLPSLPIVPRTALPPGLELRDTAVYQSEVLVGTLAHLVRNGRFVDSVDLAFGVHAVGRDSLVFLPVRAIPGRPGQADIQHHVLLHGETRVDLEERLPYFDSRFSSPMVHDGALLYWGMRPVNPNAGRWALQAMRHTFATGRLDSLRLEEKTLLTDDRFHLLLPAVYETGIVFAVDSTAWVVQPDFSRALSVPR